VPAIFISHSGRDREVSDAIKAALAKIGFEYIFMDFDKESGVGAGENWEKRLYQENLSLPRHDPCSHAELAGVQMVLRRTDPGTRARQGHLAYHLRADRRRASPTGNSDH
jgi:hypothetical protein